MGRDSSNNFVEINGRRYDARTGEPVESVKPAAKAPTPTVKNHVIDGFLPAQKRQPRKATQAHSTTKKSKTLNRAVVAKPQTARPEQSIETKKIRTPASRIERAESVAQSSNISKFENVSQPQANIVPKLPQAEPAEEHLVAGNIQQQSAETTKQPKESSLGKIAGKIRSAAKQPRMISAGATAGLLLVVAGYVTYLNIPNIALRVAAREAGFEARMPGYRPTGYEFSSPISYERGRITVRFNDQNDDKGFEITQRETNWDSQSLLDNHVVAETDLYQTYKEKGLTIYVYNGSDATWVNGGVWYSIEGDTRLNAEQLIGIATSL